MYCDTCCEIVEIAYELHCSRNDEMSIRDGALISLGRCTKCEKRFRSKYEDIELQGFHLPNLDASKFDHVRRSHFTFPIRRRSKAMHSMVQEHWDYRDMTSISIPLAFHSIQGELRGVPVGEGTTADQMPLTKQGDPHLAAEMAQAYLHAYYAVMPQELPPTRLSRILPALSLLLMAAEIGLKALLLKRGSNCKKTHSLSDLYHSLPDSVRDRIQSDFSKTIGCRNLHEIRRHSPVVGQVLSRYENTYGIVKNYALSDVRYIFEEGRTDELYWPEGWGDKPDQRYAHDIPFPVFLPEIVRIFVAIFHDTEMLETKLTES